MRPAVADAIRIIALTGARRGEIANLRWSHVDLARGLIVIPPAGHKTGRRTGAARTIAMPALAQVIIARQTGGATAKPDAFVFPPASGKGPLNLSKPWRGIRAEAGVAGQHRLRWASPFPRLAHGDGGRRGQRNHDPDGPPRKSPPAKTMCTSLWNARVGLAEKAAAVVMAGVADAEGKASGEVISIKGGRP